MQNSTTQYSDETAATATWEFAQSLVDRPIPRRPAAGQDSAVDIEHRQWLLEITGVYEAEWDPAKHPRGAFDKNPGWFSPTRGHSNKAPSEAGKQHGHFQLVGTKKGQGDSTHSIQGDIQTKLKTDTPDQRYWLVVAVDTNHSEGAAGEAGHAWVGLVDSKGDGKTGTVNGIGLYPGERVRNGAGDSIGHYGDDSGREYETARAYPVSKEQYDKITQDFQRRRNGQPPNYSLQVNNCATFALGVLKQIDRSVTVDAHGVTNFAPSERMTEPQQHSISPMSPKVLQGLIWTHKYPNSVPFGSPPAN